MMASLVNTTVRFHVILSLSPSATGVFFSFHFLLLFAAYVPQSFKESASPAIVLVTIHCFEGFPKREMAKFTALAERMGIVLIAPEGIQNSWNAHSCCGYAREHSIDDLNFIKNTIKFVITSHLSQTLSQTPVIFTGFSNGGFMSELFLYETHEEWVTGVISFGGHQYKLSNIRSGVAVMTHHSVADTMVQYNGCCDTISCCCEISEHSDVCLSVDMLFQNWTSANGCDSVTTETLQSPVVNGTLECSHGIGCLAPTVRCKHNGFDHEEWEDNMQYGDMILEFISEAVCLRHGTFQHSTKTCECEMGYAGDLCTGTTHTIHLPLWWMFAGLVAAGVAVTIAVRTRQRQREFQRLN
eukprot:c9169_g1_i2.p1 GENE.c9169_g1_i2~~c9169_g1_i2.p1  ORF type:complete len:355 (+),score=79.98 c9169_g1_i2:105-1169(+)